MTSRINYNQPLKSVRTIRAAKLEHYDPQKDFVDDPARSSDADLMHDAGVAFSWEKEPGRSKVDQETAESVTPMELKPPPQQVLAPPPSSKLLPSVEIPKSPPPAGTESNGRPFHHILNNGKLPTTEALAVRVAAAPPPVSASPQGALPVSSQPTSANHHQLPPKPTQSKPPLAVPMQPSSADRPVQHRRNTSASVLQSSSASYHHHNNFTSALLGRNGVHDQPSARRTSRKGSSGGAQELSVPKESSRRHHSALASTLQYTLTKDEDPTSRTDPNGAESLSLVPSSSDEGVPLQIGLSSRGNHEYISAKLSQSPALAVKDFYLSERHAPLSSVANGGNLIRGPNSCMPTRPNSASASEAGSHSDDGDIGDLGDSYSQMNARDTDVRCQVSMIDGDHHESTSSRHTDPRARDFIMERFLPAAKAMVTESSDGLDRRSAQEAPSVSPTRKNGRSSVLGRSRFAFKDRFAEEEEEHEEGDQPELLFKCKFPWQMGAMRSAVPVIIHGADSGSAEQSPSASFGNNKYSPSPNGSFENRKESTSPRPFSDGQHEDAAWAYAESDGSATPRGDNVCSFEERGLPPRSRTKSSPSQVTHRGQLSRDSDFYRDSTRSLSVIGESVNGDYESGEQSGRSNESTYRASPGSVPRDRLIETATQDDSTGGNMGSQGRRSPDMVYSGSLGSLLRTTQQQRRDLGRNSEAAIQAAVANVEQGPIPPASILNHHRNNPARKAAAAAAAVSSGYGANANHSPTKPTHPSNGVAPDETNTYPRHLKVNLIRQQEVAEPSGGSERSLESLNDEVWESARESPIVSESYDRSGKGRTSSISSLPESTNEGGQPPGWPLVKIQHLYARTPSSDSKDASFSSVSERSLRSPTNLALTVQQTTSTEKYSPVSVLQPPLPKSPSESWLFKVKPLAPPSTGTNWQGPKPKKFLDYSSPDDSMDVKWEVLVKSENAKLRSKMTQNGQSTYEPPLKDRLPVGLSVVG
ncbi:unnamed protein product [Calypogeia fissa]